MSGSIAIPLLTSITLLHEGHGTGELSLDDVHVHGVGHLEGVRGTGGDLEKLGFLQGGHDLMDRGGHDEVEQAELR